MDKYGATFDEMVQKEKGVNDLKLACIAGV
jgi:hypothetical protein